MKTSRVSTIRREQIIEAAIAVIDEQGIQRLSLSEIEKKTGLARGQLMYYYRSKEDILLAVFDRLLQMMRARFEAGDGNANGDGDSCPAAACHDSATVWERLEKLLTILLIQPPIFPAFHSLQYTFLSQIRHREDFRQRLANLYGMWRVRMAEGMRAQSPLTAVAPGVSPQSIATLIQAILHGLAVQRAADPNAYDADEMLRLVLDILRPYLNPTADGPNNHRKARSSVRRKAARPSQPPGQRAARRKKVTP
jgi:AcrR family transcriptional regulator